MITYLYQAPKVQSPKGSAIIVLEDICEKTEPKPLFCGELPEGLKLRMDYSGTQNYRFNQYISQGTSVSGTLTRTIQLPMIYVVNP